MPSHGNQERNLQFLIHKVDDDKIMIVRSIIDWLIMRERFWDGKMSLESKFLKLRFSEIPIQKPFSES